MISGPSTDKTADAATLVSDIATGIGRLVQGELMLARAEAAEAIRTATSGLVRVAAAAMLGLVGLNVLAGTAVTWLVAAGLSAGPAGLIVALVLFAAGVALGLSARSALRPAGLWPRRALRGLQQDARVVAGGLASTGGLTSKGTPDV